MIAGRPFPSRIVFFNFNVCIPILVMYLRIRVFVYVHACIVELILRLLDSGWPCRIVLMHCSVVFGFSVFVSLRICVLVFIEIIGRRPAMQNAFHLLLHLYYPIRQPPLFFAFFHFLPNTNENTYIHKYRYSYMQIQILHLYYPIRQPQFFSFHFLHFLQTLSCFCLIFSFTLHLFVPYPHSFNH